MLIEQISEFELRGPGSFGRTRTTITGYFHDKAKISKENLTLDYLFTTKLLQEAIYFTSSIRTKSLTKFNTKMQDFKRILDLNRK